MSWRFILGLPLAALVAFGLFVGMSKLIEPGEVEIVERKPIPDVDVTYDAEDDDPPPDRPDPSKITPPEPPEVIEDRPSIDPQPGGEDPVFPTDPVGPIGPPVIDREPQPLIQVAPQNWEPCLSSRADEDHYVQLVFDVSPTGETANIEVASSSVSCLERSAIRAAQGWRYAPKIENGEAVWQYGVKTTIRFRLEG